MPCHERLRFVFLDVSCWIKMCFSEGIGRPHVKNTSKPQSCHQHHQIAVPAFARWCCQWWSYSYLQWAVCTTWRWKSQCPPCHRWVPIPQGSATASRSLTVLGASSFNDRFFPGTRTPACRSLSCNKHREHNYWRHVLMLGHDSINIVYGYISCVYYISFYISLYILIYLYVPI